MNEVRVTRAEWAELMKRLVREGNQIREVTSDEDSDDLVVRFERRTEIRTAE